MALLIPDGEALTQSVSLLAKLIAADSDRKNLVTLVRWMAEAGGYDVHEIADAVEKPWHHMDLLEQAQLQLDAVMAAGTGMNTAVMSAAMAELAER